jgi:CheY-like chemotaxis protein
MVRNLVSNAVKYTTSGGVRVECERQGNEVVLTVEDTGPGIAREDQERIFDEFVQIGNPQRLRDRGVGLGLAIVRHISILLGHPVSVDSEPGRGTRMTIRMPAASAALVSADASEASAELDLTGKLIWVVEDDPDVREALVTYFRQRRCECEAVESRSALETLAARADRTPDFVLLDDMLSDSDSGLDIARWLTSRMERRRIMIMTGNVDPGRWRELEASGFTVLRKPISTAALNEWMSQAETAKGRKAAMKAENAGSQLLGSGALTSS